MTGRQDDRQEYDRQRTLDEYMIKICAIFRVNLDFLKGTVHVW
jgi:hypothetical protein